MSHLDVRDTSTLGMERQACSAGNNDFQDFSHNMMDFGLYGPEGNEREIPRMIVGAARLEVAVATGAAGTGINTLDVNVRVTNTKAGHKFPTDSPLRHLILVVKAVDRVNTPLMYVGDKRIPNWAGPGPISPSGIAVNLNRSGIVDYSGLPGKVFANLLVEEETNLSPAMAYWNETKYAFVDAANGGTSDTRLAPSRPDLSAYSFAMPDEGNVKVTVQLVYRYAFYDLIVWKEWFDRSDIIVATMECNGPARRPEQISCERVEFPESNSTP